MNFNANHNNFRKTYSTRRTPERIEIYTVNSSSIYYDANSATRHRDWFILKSATSNTSPIGSGLVAWYSWEDLPAAGVNVATWANRVAGGVNLTSPGGSQPLVATIGSRRSVNFPNASVLYLQSVFALVQPEEIFVVLRNNNWTANKTIWDGIAGASAKMGMQTGAGPISKWLAGATISVTSNIPAPGAMSVVHCCYNGTSSFATINGIIVASGSVGFNNAGGLSFGKTLIASTSAACDIMAVLLYNRVLSSLERDYSYRFLVAQCGL
jgi:hypothetical protein